MQKLSVASVKLLLYKNPKLVSNSLLLGRPVEKYCRTETPNSVRIFVFFFTSTVTYSMILVSYSYLFVCVFVCLFVCLYLYVPLV